MRKIESLTPQQEQDLRDYFDESMRIGTCCDTADKPKAEAAITAMYAHIGKPSPRFVWCDSPATCALAIAYTKGESKGASLGDSLWDSLRDSLWASLGASLGASLRDSLRDSLRASLGDSLGASYYGQHEQSWIAFYTFCERIGVPYQADRSKQLGWWRDIAQSSCWWFPYSGICFISDRPSEVHINDRRVLHCENGPAMKFRDGWSVWAVNGVHLGAKGEQIILSPEKQTLAEIRSEQNEEIKRIRIERFAWERYLRESKAKVVHRRRNDVENTRESLMAIEDHRVLVCACPSTARVYSLEVPKEIETCEAAQAYLWSGSRLLTNRRVNIVGRT